MNLDKKATSVEAIFLQHVKKKKTRWAKGFFSFLFEEDNCVCMSGRGSIDRYTPSC